MAAGVYRPYRHIRSGQPLVQLSLTDHLFGRIDLACG
jgi:hypothetical protein